MKNLIYLILLVSLLIGCSKASDRKNNSDLPPIQELYQRFLDDLNLLYPHYGNFLGINQQWDKLPNNVSLTFLQEEKEVYNNYLDRINQYERNLLPGSDQINYDIIKS